MSNITNYTKFLISKGLISVSDDKIEALVNEFLSTSPSSSTTTTSTTPTPTSTSTTTLTPTSTTTTNITRCVKKLKVSPKGNDLCGRPISKTGISRGCLYCPSHVKMCEKRQLSITEHHDFEVSKSDKPNKKSEKTNKKSNKKSTKTVSTKSVSTKGVRVYYNTYWTTSENYRDLDSQNDLVKHIAANYEGSGTMLFYDERVINDISELERMYEIYSNKDNTTFSPDTTISTVSKEEFVKSATGKSFDDICDIFNLTTRYFYFEKLICMGKIEDGRMVYNLIIGT